MGKCQTELKPSLAEAELIEQIGNDGNDGKEVAG